MKKEYISKVKNVPAKGRGKRNTQDTTGKGAVVYMSAGGSSTSSGAQGHTHANKADLDALSIDAEGYVYISRYAEIINEETNEVEVKLITERVKAGYADKSGYADYAEIAYDLTEDSPANKRFLSRLLDDMAQGFITFCQGLKSKARAIFGNFVAGSDGAKIDPNGDAEFNEVIARKRLTVGAPVVAGVSGGGIWVDEFGNTHLQVDFAEVTKRATFAEVEVKKLRHVGGVMILSAASMECNAVIETESSYVCYFDTEPEQYPGKHIANEFRVGDLARSQTCNLRQGTTQNAANRYYWRRVINIGDDFIELSKADCDPAGTNDAPLPGDSIIQMGNVYDPQRQNIIIIAAYGAGSPYIYQFKGIDDYTLPDRKCKTKISPDGNRFSGELIVETGTKNQAIADYVNDLSGVYRLVAEVNNVPKTVADTGEVTDLSLQVRCKAYRIEGGDMKRLTFESTPSFGFLSVGSTLLNLGGSLLRLGDGEEPELLTMTRTYYRQDTATKTLKEKLTTSYNAASTFVLADDVVKVVFTLWRNGEKVAETAVDGTAQLNLTRTRFAVLDDRITSEVEQIGQSISTIEQTADKISLKVDKINSAASANLARGTMSPDTLQTYLQADNNPLQFPLTGITILNPRAVVTVSFDFKILTTFTSAVGSSYSFLFAMGSHPLTGTSQSGWIPLASLSQSIVSGTICLSGSVSTTIDLSNETADTLSIFGMIRPEAVVKLVAISGLRVNLGSTALPWQPYAGETESRLNATGIDIEHKKITLTADNVQILNNAGKRTASFDADGEFCAHRVIARNSAGRIIAAMNAEGQGEYTMYYAETGKRRLQLSPSADRDKALIYYAEDGTTPIWTLGANGFSWKLEQEFVRVTGYGKVSEATAKDPNQVWPQANLFQFIASENSQNRAFDGLYFEKNTGEDLNSDRADGTYYAIQPVTESGSLKRRHFMTFSNGTKTASGYIHLNS